LWVIAWCSWSWTHLGMVFTCLTDVPAHLYLRFTLDPPAEVPVYRTIRGVRVKCGVRFKVRSYRVFEQQEPGSGWNHTFYVTDWPCQTPGWWYLRGHTGVGWSGSQSLLYTDYRPCSADPLPLPAPVRVTSRVTIARAGNHYTWFANHTWYCVVPSRNWIEVFKMVGGSFIRQDFANQPAAFGGAFKDCDSRLSIHGDHITIVYTWRNALFPPDRVCVVHFNCLTDTWGPVVYPAQITSHRPLNFLCSLALDLYDNIHIAFSYRSNLPCVTAYLGFYDGSWGIPVPIITTSLSEQKALSVVCDHGNTFHVASSGVYYDMHYNSRPLRGSTGHQYNFPDSVSNVHGVSIAVRFGLPHILFIDYALTLRWAAFADEAWAHFPTTSLQFPAEPNIFTPAYPPYPEYAFLTVWPARLHPLTSAYPRWLPWDAGETLQWDTLAATRNGPAVVSFLGTQPQSPHPTYFHALSLPS